MATEMRRKASGTLLLAMAVAAVLTPLAVPGEASGLDATATRALFTAMMKAEMAERVSEQSKKIGEACDDAAKAEIAAEAEKFCDALCGKVQQELVTVIGSKDMAYAAFSDFVDTFARAAMTGDKQTLSSVSKALGMEKPESFTALRTTATDTLLAKEVEASGKFLGGIQTWVRLKAKDGGKGEVPPLTAWISRDEKIPEKAQPAPAPASVAAPPAASAPPVVAAQTPPSQPPSPPTPAPPKKRPRSLRDMEAPASSFVAEKDEGNGPLRSFAEARRSERERVFKEAEAGMAQVTAERRAEEEAANARRLAALQAEANALQAQAIAQQAQAQRLAVQEQQMVVQDYDIWRTRLKGSLSFAVRASTDESVAGRLGVSLINSIFKRTKDPLRKRSKK